MVVVRVRYGRKIIGREVAKQRRVSKGEFLQAERK